jgi:hypothetical protein
VSDAAHLLIPFASCDDPGCVQAQTGLELPALEKLLARLEAASAIEGDENTLSMPHERAEAREAGIDAADGRIPWAAWQVAQSGRDHEGAAWAWITPCHWQVGQDHVSMAHPQQLGLADAESQALLAVMQPWFEQDGIALAYDEPTRWLARGEVFRDLPAASLDRVTGRVIDRWMPRGERAKGVRRLQQEMQMLLYTHEINEERARAGRPVINSFWVSGAGALPPAALPHAPPRLQVADSLRDAALRGDWAAWAAGWRQVDANECGALLARLDRGEHVAVTLCGQRNARTFAGAGGGFFGKLRATLRGPRVRQVLETL